MRCKDRSSNENGEVSYESSTLFTTKSQEAKQER